MKLFELKFQKTLPVNWVVKYRKTLKMIPQIKKVVKNRFQSKCFLIVKTDRKDRLCINLTDSNKAIKANTKGRIRYTNVVFLPNTEES